MDISANIFGKMGEDNPKAMDTLAKNAIALQYELDDIVEIISEVEGNVND